MSSYTVSPQALSTSYSVPWPTRACQTSLASLYFLARKDGWLRSPAKNRNCLKNAFCTGAGASAIASAARSDKTMVIYDALC
jgi:hypothetical protein